MSKDGGFRRPFVGMAVAMVAALGGFQAGIPETEQPKLSKNNNKRKRNRTGVWQSHPLTDGVPGWTGSSSTSQQKHGGRECARRVRQRVNGAQYVHGAQYSPFSFTWVDCSASEGCLFAKPANHWKGKF